MPDHDRSFLEEFLHGNKGKRDINLDALNRNAINHDKWDDEDFQHVMDEMKELSAAEDKLTDVVETGSSAFADQFFSLIKANPELAPKGSMRPSHQVNHAVAAEAMELQEWEELRLYSTGDEIASALGCIAMEPELEILFDKLKKEQEMAKQLQEQLEQWNELNNQESSLDDLIRQLEEEGGDTSQAQAQKDQVGNQKNQLEQSMGQGQNELDQSMQGKAQDIKSAMKQAMGQAAAQAEQAEDTAQAWGLDPGTLQRMPYEKRIELAKKLNNERFRKIAKLFGPMHRMAFAEQQRKTVYTPEEIYDVEMGNDLSRVLAVELLQTRHPLLKLDFFRRFVEGSLIQYKLKGTEKLAKGGIIFCEDGSGSMSGDREIWAKAVGLTLLQIAKAQKRPFYGIHFGGPRQIKCFDFRDPKNATVEQVIEFAEAFFGGGPLRVDQLVATPNEGMTPIGNLVVGDKVFGPDGVPCNVIGVYPQGKLDLYEVTFRDGAKVVCDASHIWTVKKRGSDTYHDKTLQSILDDGLRYEHSSGGWFQYSVPNQAPVQYSEKEYTIHPYLLGYLLGDGTLGGNRSAVIHSSEQDQPWRQFAPSTVVCYNEKNADRCGSYGLIGMTEMLKPLGLFGVRGENKFVPSEYLYGSINQRFDLLCGLLDSDGNTAQNGGFEFCNTSEHLCEAVVQLAQSLGGVATLHEKKVRENEKPLFRVKGRIHPTLGAPFKLARKLESYVPHEHEYVRSIVSAERVGTDEAVCIKVDREDGLFLTEGYVVTHNTDFATPLSKAVDVLREDNMNRGAVKADIVFCTDGQCGVTEKWLQEFKDEQARLAFRVYGVIIGGSRESEPLKTIADGRVLTVKDLHRGDDLREVFKNL